ncbi:MAG: hypothetical protein C4522_22105 [Desulfobacteraceae bacterium]|nr:MAG: hypothetical protein C4522_22105 [Desulfobacteraceae bacterium]
MKSLIQSKHGMKTVDLNRRKSIRERCLNCAGWNLKEVKNCQFSDCPLYPFLSGIGKQEAKARSKAIRDYCLWCCNGQLLKVSRCHNSDCPLFAYRKTVTDRTAEINSMPKKDHIEASQEAKKENEYSDMDKLINLVGVGVGTCEKNLCSPGIDPAKVLFGRYDGEKL